MTVVVQPLPLGGFTITHKRAVLPRLKYGLYSEEEEEEEKEIYYSIDSRDDPCSTLSHSEADNNPRTLAARV